MTTDLETLIVAAQPAAITLWNRNGRYQANVSRDGGKSWTVEHHTDPIEALKLALTERTFQTTDEDIFA